MPPDTSEHTEQQCHRSGCVHRSRLLPVLSARALGGGLPACLEFDRFSSLTVALSLSLSLAVCPDLPEHKVGSRPVCGPHTGTSVRDDTANYYQAPERRWHLCPLQERERERRRAFWARFMLAHTLVLAC